jgi:hypothetical protein
MVKELVAKLQHFLDSGYVDPNLKEDDGEEVEAERSSPSRCHALRVAFATTETRIGQEERSDDE